MSIHSFLFLTWALLSLMCPGSRFTFKFIPSDSRQGIEAMVAGAVSLRPLCFR
jgi:hypothetical protein